jgi:hypothetical protein
MEASGVRPVEDGIGVGEVDPFVGELVAVQDVQGFVDAEQVGDAGDAVDFQHPRGVLLPFVERGRRQAAEQLARILVAHLPGGGQAEKAFRADSDSRSRSERAEVDQHRRFEAALGVGVREAHEESSGYG